MNIKECCKFCGRELNKTALRYTSKPDKYPKVEIKIINGKKRYNSAKSYYVAIHNFCDRKCEHKYHKGIKFEIRKCALPGCEKTWNTRDEPIYKEYCCKKHKHYLSAKKYAQSEKGKEKAKEYYLTKGKLIRRTKEWKAKQKKWREKNKDKIKAYKEKHKERIREYKRQWKKQWRLKQKPKEDEK